MGLARRTCGGCLTLCCLSSCSARVRVCILGFGFGMAAKMLLLLVGILIEVGHRVSDNNNAVAIWGPSNANYENMNSIRRPKAGCRKGQRTEHVVSCETVLQQHQGMRRLQGRVACRVRIGRVMGCFGGSSKTGTLFELIY